MKGRWGVDQRLRNFASDSQPPVPRRIVPSPRRRWGVESMVMITTALTGRDVGAENSRCKPYTPHYARGVEATGLGRRTMGWVFQFAYLTRLAPMSANRVQAAARSAVDERERIAAN